MGLWLLGAYIAEVWNSRSRQRCIIQYDTIQYNKFLFGSKCTFFEDIIVIVHIMVSARDDFRLVDLCN